MNQALLDGLDIALSVGFSDCFTFSREYAKKTDYSLDDAVTLLNEQNLPENKYSYKTGIYLTTILQQKMTENDTITIEENYLPNLGYLWQKGTLQIGINHGYNTGVGMTGGNLFITTNQGDYTGWIMTGGNLITDKQVIIKSPKKLRVPLNTDTLQLLQNPYVLNNAHTIFNAPTEQIDFVVDQVLKVNK